MKKIYLLLLMLGFAGRLLAAEAEDPVQLLEAWKADRTAKLIAPDGWLSLTGLHFLKNGESTVGRAPDNAVVLSGGSAHLGTVRLSDDGVVRLFVTPGTDVKIDGREETSVDLIDDVHAVEPTKVTSGTLSFYVVDRAGKKALRVKDTASDRRAHFLGIDYFPYDPSWQIKGRWEAFPRPRQLAIKNKLGQGLTVMALGKVSFEREGKTYELLPIQEHADDPLFFVISDLTSGAETYEAARFLEAVLEKDGTVILDFNRAVNPPCAFTPFATCPLPPKENRLPLLIQAGEKNYRGAEH